MFKKSLYLLIIIVIVAIIAFNGYKFKIYKDFHKYLNENYKDKSFKLSWVGYDFLNNKFPANVHCNNDNTDFSIVWGGNEIFEDYLIRRNTEAMQEIIKSYLMEKDFSNHIQSVHANIEEGINVLNTKEKIDYSKFIYNISIMYKYKAIKDHSQFAETSIEVVKTLRNNGIKLSLVSFDYETDKQIYKLLLQEEDINKQKSDIVEMIKRRK